MKNILTVCATFLILGACKENPSTSEAAGIPPSYPIFHPVLKDTSFTQEYVATIQALQHIEIRSVLASALSEILVEEGQLVKKGQVLFRLNRQRFLEERSSVASQLRAAESELKTLELERSHTRALVEKQVVSNAELDLLSARMEVLNAKVQEAKALLEAKETMVAYTEIRAPFEGIVGRIPNKVGSLVDEQTLLTTLSNNQAVYAYFPVSEREFLAFQKKEGARGSKPLRLLLADGSEIATTGKLEVVDSAIDPSTGTISLKARFPNPGNLIRQGASAKVLLEQPIKSALMIPQMATFEVQDKTYVYLIDNQNKVVLRAIEPSMRVPNWYVVAAGLSTNDRVLLEGLQKVKVGERVEPFLAEPRKLSLLVGN